MTTTVTTNKPFHIDKKRVYEAYKAVRSNRGAAGVDGQTLEQFDEDLGGNLYKIWNRMSSGSYFPPPVRAVSIPKKNGGGELKTPLITTQRHYTRPRVRENSGCWSSSRVNASISGCNQRSGIVGIRS
jgi:hypothetical protein